jgi:hypothetical protein
MAAFCAQVLPSSVPNRTVQAVPPADHKITRPCMSGVVPRRMPLRNGTR